MAVSDGRDAALGADLSWDLKVQGVGLGFRVQVRVQDPGFRVGVGLGVRGLGFEICRDIASKQRWSCHKVASSASCPATCVPSQAAPNLFQNLFLSLLEFRT